MPPSHCRGHRDGHELWFVLVPREYQGEAWAVLRSEEHAVEPVLDVVLAESRRAELRVGMSYLIEDTVEGTSELHGFGGSMRKSRFID